MSVRSTIFVWLLLVVMAIFPAAIRAAAQSDNPPQQMPPIMPSQRPSPADEERARMEKDMAKKANQARWQQLKRDTDNLLKLSTELKEYVDKANENTLSLDVIKKAEEIEKLAHSVKDKMKGD
ncbi:MAG TPA: hypothetical protein VF753_10875 [Terriglobales bacterium]